MFLFYSNINTIVSLVFELNEYQDYIVQCACVGLFRYCPLPGKIYAYVYVKCLTMCVCVVGCHCLYVYGSYESVYNLGVHCFED